MATDSEKVINQFCKAWERKNLDELMEYFAEDAVYHNIPMEPARGKAAIRQVINTFLPMAESVAFKVLNTASAGDVVINERVDIFKIGPKTIEIPVAGVFEVKNGKIAAWRDYFDLATWTRQSQ